MFRASAPGSLMLMGEYAVLHGHKAIVCAIDKRMTVTLSARNDTTIRIHSALGVYETTLSDLARVEPFQYVLAVFQVFHHALLTGYDVTIESEFSATVGFASSAAVTVALIAALAAEINTDLTELEHIRLARDVIQAVQGVGSGADAAACVLGGIVAYHMEPLAVHKFAHLYPITVIFSGHKTPTGLALAQMKEKLTAHPVQYKQLLTSIGSCVEAAIPALEQNNMKDFSYFMTMQQGLMAALGVSTPLLDEIVRELLKQPSISTAKISGSGLGDCVIGMGTIEQVLQFSSQAVQIMDVQMSGLGVVCEKV